MPHPAKVTRNVDQTFGATLREAREKLGLSQAALAETMQGLGFDFQQQTIYKIESGNRRATIGEAAGFARALQIDDLNTLVYGKNSLEVTLVLRPVVAASDDLFFTAQRLMKAQLTLGEFLSAIDDIEDLPERQVEKLRNALRFDAVEIAAEAKSFALRQLEESEMDEPFKAIIRAAWQSTGG
ncbi:helix-turn-helix transcriptional regulator [Microbacterium sp. kSW2-24]|uniref:helix-turn-helix domain-containing protein n=1 Tax=Microbacterium galbinum TaxID=2851646 RepID=UPI001FFCCCB7|nr:helix-turn-helix transcriptional regulator [Microbacterium galbinum]MCK2022772.1 helix-turn-helix transcriptional regulator [Microbacterium galbinum]